VSNLCHIANLTSFCKFVPGLFKLLRAAVAQALLALHFLEKLLDLGFLHEKQFSFLCIESLSKFVEGLLDLHASPLLVV